MLELINTINTISNYWFNWNINMLWQIAVLFTIILTIDTLIKNHAWPQVRYAMWLMLILKLILPPSFALNTSITSGIQPIIAQNIEIKTPTVNLPEPQLKTSIHQISKQREESKQLPAKIETASPPLKKDLQNNLPGPTLQWQGWLALCWITGLFLLTNILLLRLKKLRDYKTTTSPISARVKTISEECCGILNLKKKPEIIISTKAISPFVFGLIKPTVILPAKSLDELSDTDLRHHLLHELAHIKRGDLLIHAIYVIIQLLYWFNPIVWIIGRNIRHLREICCDGAVASVLREETLNYRQTLLATARRLLAEPTEPAMGLLGLFEDSNRLLARLQWLEKQTWKNRGLQYSTSITAGLLMILCLLPMAQGKNKEPGTTQRLTSQWKTVSTCNSSIIGEGPAVMIINDVHWFSPTAFNGGKKTSIIVNHHYMDADFRILTKTKDAKEIITTGATKSFNGNLCTMQCIIDSPINNIESFSIQFRSLDTQPDDTHNSFPENDILNYLQQLHNTDDLAHLDNILRNIIGNTFTRATYSRAGKNQKETLNDNIPFLIATLGSMRPSLLEKHSNSPISDTLNSIITSLDHIITRIDNDQIDEAINLINETSNNQLKPLLDKIDIIKNKNPSHIPEFEPTKIKGFYHIITNNLIQYDPLDGEEISHACRRAIESLEFSEVINKTENSISYNKPYLTMGSATYHDKNYDHTGYKSYIESKDENQKLIRCEFITIPGKLSTVSLTCELDEKDALIKAVVSELNKSSTLKLWPESIAIKTAKPELKKYQKINIEIHQQLLEYFTQLQNQNRLQKFNDEYNGITQAINSVYATTALYEPKLNEQCKFEIEGIIFDINKLQNSYPNDTIKHNLTIITNLLEMAASNINDNDYSDAIRNIQRTKSPFSTIIQSNLTRKLLSKPNTTFFPETKQKGYYKIIGMELLTFDTNDMPLVSHICHHAVTNVSYYDNDFSKAITTPEFSVSSNTSNDSNGLIKGMRNIIKGNDKNGNKFLCEMIIISGQPITLTVKDTSGDYRLLNEILNQLSYTHLQNMPND